MKFCFLARALQTRVFVKMAIELKSRGHEVFFVTQSDIDDRQVYAAIPDAKVYQIAQYLRDNWALFTKEKLDQLAEKYQEVDLWQLFYTDRFLRKFFDYDDSVHFLVGHILFYEEILYSEKPNMFIDETITTYSSYIAYYIGKRTGTLGGYITNGRRYDKPTFFIASDPCCVMPQLQDIGEDFDEDALLRVQEYINNYMSNKGQPDYMRISGRRPQLKLKHWLFPLRNVFYSFQKRFHDKYSYPYFHYNKALTSPFYIYWNYLLSKKYYLKPNLDCKFYLFPLHVQPEASTIVAAEKYENQLFALEQLAKSIPGDAVIYAKEHYAGLGQRPIGFYKALQKYPNIVLVSPDISIHSLLEKCFAVTTLTSTAGMEALFYEKPVFVFGDVFYQYCKGVVKIDDIYNQRDLLKKPVAINREDVNRFICRYLQELEDGCFDLADLAILDNKNIHILCNELIHHYDRMRAE